MANPPDIKAKHLVAELREAARAAGLQPTDPLAPLISAFIHTIQNMFERTAQSDHIATMASRRIAQTINQSRQAADAEVDRFRASLAKTEAETVSQIATAIVQTAEAAWDRRVRAFDRNTAWLAASILFVAAAVSLAGGDWWGRTRAYTEIHETEDGLHAAFIDGPESAREWRELMELNDLRVALATCDVGRGSIHVEGGRRWCQIPMWIDGSPKPQAPR